MKSCYLLILLLVTVYGSEDCTRFLQALSKDDIFLNGRKNLATELMADNVTAGEFVARMDSPSVTAGEKYQCGNTRFWVDTLYRGSLNQYEELRGSDNGYGTGAGYQDLAGDAKLTALFNSVIQFT